MVPDGPPEKTVLLGQTSALVLTNASRSRNVDLDTGAEETGNSLSEER